MHCVIQVPNVTLGMWYTHYKALGLELSLKLPISNSLLCHWGTNCSSNFCCRRSMLRHSHSPNTVVFPLNSIRLKKTTEPGLLAAAPFLDDCSQQLCTVDTFRPSLSAISREDGKKIHLPVALLHDLVQTR
ncbi:hypothetical protein TNCV_2981321 [Trichonephila clavipes]|nr:hypothetical protein TNCV_2981321 [Trichonephila clavipes]